MEVGAEAGVWIGLEEFGEPAGCDFVVLEVAVEEYLLYGALGEQA